jgi:pimeloyl-ACP methyl ester carboxylesterase
MLDLSAQMRCLWPSYPDSQPSQYFKFIPGHREVLDITFPSAYFPEGRFTFDEMPHPNDTLLLNVEDNDFYQRGIPGVTNSIDETVEWVRSIRDMLGASTVRTFGNSMGGYGALLFGALVPAQAMYVAGALFTIEARLVGVIREITAR